MTTLFISDLHLNAAHPDVVEQAVEFLRTDARDAEHLYILGDLFEFWIGDDDQDPVYGKIQDELKALTSSGVGCSVMYGNRDFLMGKQFERRTGCKLIADYTLINLYGEQVLLLHGDTLCTDDHSYQRLRRIVRNPLVQWIFKCMSLQRRERLAARIRVGSQKHTKTANTMIMDVNPHAVERTFTRYKVTTMIHGHTHRPTIHTHALPNHVKATRIVLGDWHQQGSVLRWSEKSGYALVSLPR
jgi:UDP-2,3-diacylglucosamine hydrolase